ncbi:hypothetical protein NHQ30_004591 [Ciborinia camelliae]|nr:hypothetical protein NHQ30_004591 [Ciborinia camelliae]
MRLAIIRRKEGILEEIDGDFPMDEAIISVLPKESKVLSAEAYGDTAWTQTGRITVALGDVGRSLVRGEHTAIELIDRLIPGLVPKPLAWGEYNFQPSTYFSIEDFHRIDMSLPDPTKLAHGTLQLHSQVSPNGLFGFPVSTFDGIAPHPAAWETKWTVFFFTKILRQSVKSDAQTNGVWPELSLAAEQLLTVVVPKLLDPLQEGPDPIVPRLIHGDLWSGNIGMGKETGEVIFVDAGSFYARNEMDIGMWRRYGVQNLGQAYLKEYKQLFPP